MATDDPAVRVQNTGIGDTTTPFLMDRRSPLSTILPGVWTEPIQCGTTFASVVLPGCQNDSTCAGVTSTVSGHCENNVCVGRRDLGDYEGMAFVPAFASFGNGSNEWNPVWTDQPPPMTGSLMHTSFDDAGE